MLLICNVASQCGFSGQVTAQQELFKQDDVPPICSADDIFDLQYIELAELYNRFKDRGFVVLGVPCNQFGGEQLLPGCNWCCAAGNDNILLTGQEPGNSASIKAFAKGKGFPTGQRVLDAPIQL